MNIFILDEDPVKAAVQQCDKHVVCMPREATEMLVMVNNLDLVGFAPSHKKHPCTLWAAASFDNYMWLHTHAMALFGEYTARYKKTHAYETIADYLETPHVRFEHFDRTPFALCMPDEYKRDTAVESYRAYYRSKARFTKWKRNQPDWW